ncbi:hypothetical protein [Hydrogenophaga sp. NFH-34]|uniref:hypothetical protein n=1 Tax=Hydrogenophaga sp. NFH-34 TaxID=2744446 RepID=UPI001F1898A0|nr:hypothetical protein [Hydrogenophaga sp. NFH-34]
MVIEIALGIVLATVLLALIPILFVAGAEIWRWCLGDGLPMMILVIGCVTVALLKGWLPTSNRTATEMREPVKIDPSKVIWDDPTPASAPAAGGRKTPR